MKDYKYVINGNEYNVTIGEIEGNMANVEVNGVAYKVEMPERVEAPKPVARPVHVELQGTPKSQNNHMSLEFKVPLCVLC